MWNVRFIPLVPLVILIAILASGGNVNAATATAVHIYKLNGSFADELGGPALVPAGGTLNATNYSFEPNQGLALSNGLPDPGSYSIEVVFRFATTNSWRKIIDFKDLASDSGLYNLNTALQLYPFPQGPSGAFTANVDTHLAVTRDDITDEFTGYVNGVQQFVLTDSGEDTVFTGVDNIAHFFKDDFATSQGEASAGVVDRIVIYDGVLTPAQVADVFGGAQPPGVSVPSLSEWGLAVLAGLLAAAFVRRLRRISQTEHRA